MAATIELQSCNLQMRRIVGTTPEGKNKLSSLTLEGINPEAVAATLLGVSGAINAVSADPIANVYRNDKNLVSAGE